MHGSESRNEKLVLSLFAVLVMSREDHFELYPFIQAFEAALSLLRPHTSIKRNLRYFRKNPQTGIYYELERIIAKFQTLHYCHVTSANPRKPKLVIGLQRFWAELLLDRFDDNQLLVRAAGAWAKKYHENIRRV